MLDTITLQICPPCPPHSQMTITTIKLVWPVTERDQVLLLTDICLHQLHNLQTEILSYRSRLLISGSINAVSTLYYLFFAPMLQLVINKHLLKWVDWDLFILHHLRARTTVTVASVIQLHSQMMEVFALTASLSSKPLETLLRYMIELAVTKPPTDLPCCVLPHVQAIDLIINIHPCVQLPTLPPSYALPRFYHSHPCFSNLTSPHQARSAIIKWLNIFEGLNSILPLIPRPVSIFGIFPTHQLRDTSHLSQGPCNRWCSSCYPVPVSFTLLIVPLLLLCIFIWNRKS